MSRFSVLSPRSSDWRAAGGLAFAAALLLATAAGAAGAAGAAERTILGQRLVLSLSQDSATTVQVNPALAHGVRIIGDSLSCVSAVGGSTAVIAQTSSCDNDTPLLIAVPPGFPVTLSSAGDGEVRVDDTQGPVTASVTGSGRVSIGDIGSLILAVRGDADVEVNHVGGTATIEHAGSSGVHIRSLQGTLLSRQSSSGDVVIDRIESGEATLQIEGSGDARIAGGTLGRLIVHSNGSGDVTAGPDIHDADIRITGSGDVHLSRVAGMVRRDTTGSGSLVVGGTHTESESPIPPVPPIPPFPAMPAFDVPGVHVEGGTHSRSRHHSDSGAAGPIVAGIILLVLGTLIWRTVRRGGGLNRMRARFGSPPVPQAATHPGVMAVRDTIGRLESRLARVEGYVTSREFDLHRKFREMDARK